jgi:histidinol-phosphatase (PHP family)
MSEKCISNFHTHTELCKHASGVPADYCRQAQQDGCSALGFSDHCPYPDDNPVIWPNIRMSASQARQYIEAVKSEAAVAAFPVYVGFECEWDKKYMSWYHDELLGTFGAQYLVLGSHWLTKGNEHIYAMNIDSVADLHTYIDQTIEGMRSGLYAFIAHPDLFMGHWKEYDRETRSCFSALLDAAKDCSMPVEINGLGMNRPMNMTKNGMRYQYPYDEFWELAAEKRVKVICNADAHDPHDVIASAWQARQYAEKFGLLPIDFLF